MRVIDVVIKDLKVISSDRKALAIMVLMPMILCTILSFALGSSFADEILTNKIQVAIVKKYEIKEEVEKFQNIIANGIVGQNLTEKEFKKLLDSAENINIEKIFFEDFLKSKEISEILEYKVLEEDVARELLNKKEVSAIIVLPEDLAFDMYINFLTPFRNKIDLKVISHSDKYYNGQIVQEIVNGFSDMISSIIISKNVFTEVSLEQNIGNRVFEDMGYIMDEMKDNVQKLGASIEYEKLNGKNPISSFAYYSVAMTTMFILYAASLGGKSLLEEKDNITYQRMVITGASKWRILMGKLFTVFMVALIQIGVMVMYTSLALKVHWGNPYLVLIISILIAFSIAGLGTLIAALTFKSGNYKMANAFEGGIIQLMALIGGSFVPVNIMPKFIQGLSKFTINGIALKSYFKVIMGYGIQEIIVPLLSLVTMGLVFTFVAIYILRKEEGWKNVKHNKAETYKTA